MCTTKLHSPCLHTLTPGLGGLSPLTIQTPPLLRACSPASCLILSDLEFLPVMPPTPPSPPSSGPQSLLSDHCDSPCWLTPPRLPSHLTFGRAQSALLSESLPGAPLPSWQSLNSSVYHKTSGAAPMCGRLCQDGQLLSRTQMPPPRVALLYHGASVTPGSLSGCPSPAPFIPNTSCLVSCHPGRLAGFSDNKRFTLLSSNQPALLAVPLGARHALCTHTPSESSLEL